MKTLMDSEKALVRLLNVLFNIYDTDAIEGPIKVGKYTIYEIYLVDDLVCKNKVISQHIEYNLGIDRKTKQIKIEQHLPQPETEALIEKLAELI